MIMVRVYVESYGCPRNKADGEIMEAFLRMAGYSVVDSWEEADYVIVNTCAVKDPTERRMVRRIRELLDKGKKVIAAGCLVHVNPGAIDGRVSGMIGVRDLDRIGEVIATAEKGGRAVFISGNDRSVDKLTLPRVWKKGISFTIPISEGCLSSCTYCATRFARGRLKSYSPKLILKWVRDALSRGYREIWLSSEDTGCYGLDIGTNLAELLREITSIEGDFRVRVGMANPDHVLGFLDDLVDAYLDNRIYSFVHLPLQSGDDGILRRMGRNYTAEEFEEIVRTFRRKIRDINITTDVIVGFPGEDDEAFRNTVEVIKRVGPDKINVSRYSPRPGTPAARWRQLPGWVVKERSRLLHRLRLSISHEINMGYIGREVEVMIHGAGPKGGIEGRTHTYKEIIMRDIQASPGEIVKVKVKGATATYLLGF